MMKNASFAFIGAFSMICALILFSAFSNNPLAETITNYLPQVIKSAYSGEQTNFCGELMPLNEDTKERLDRELSVNSYWQSSTLLNIKLAQKYFPTIERILREEGIPDDFKYLAVAESGLRNVGSPAGARGYWQFMKLSAKEFGLEVNSEVDERLHLEKSTRAACKYLKRLQNRFGSWTNAAASYNVGPTKYSSELRTQKEESYYNLNLNQETARYVFRLIALKEIMKQPEKYGYYLDHSEKYFEMSDYYEVVVDKSISSWSSFAKEKGISYRMLKRYNPWLIDSKLTVKNNTYKIKIPRNR